MIRGERFEVDLGSDDEEQAGSEQPTTLYGAFVGDILERKPASAKPPSAPTLKSSTGFPEHRKRNVESRFKQRGKQTGTQLKSPAGASASGDSSAQNAVPSVGGDAKPKSWEEEEKQRIDAENSAKLASMSASEIEEERRELMSSLSPAMIQRLLMRSNIESGSNESNLFPAPERRNKAEPSLISRKKTVAFAEPAPELSTKEDLPDDENDAAKDDDTEPTDSEHLPHDSVHFPQPQQPPDLDPSSATFLEDLHEKYFPSLPADPDKLEWMQSTKFTNKNAYDPSATAFNAKDIRFSFTGELIAPRTAAQIPVTAGLHHHGESPNSAGYTIAELAHLARSSYAAQRCIAFQTLGRILYRLGKGEFGDAGEPGEDVDGSQDTFGELARGLWREMETLKVVETLVRESEGQGVDRGKHVSAKAYATEAVWLWQKGGGRRWKAN